MFTKLEVEVEEYKSKYDLSKWTFDQDDPLIPEIATKMFKVVDIRNIVKDLYTNKLYYR